MAKPKKKLSVKDDYTNIRIHKNIFALIKRDGENEGRSAVKQLEVFLLENYDGAQK